MQGLIYKSDTEHPWHLIEELPEEPMKLNPVIQDLGLRHEYKRKHQEYQSNLHRAISNAVRVENQEAAKNILLRALNWNPHPDEHRFEPDKVYPAEVSYEIYSKCQYMEVDGGCPDCFHGHLCERVARLLPCKEEGKDTKPDFEKLASEYAEPFKTGEWFETIRKEAVKWGCERIWTEYVEPLRAEIERLKEGK